MGYECVDENALKKRGIVLGNTVHATADRVAELTVGLLIATARNVLDANQQMKSYDSKIINILLIFTYLVNNIERLQRK